MSTYLDLSISNLTSLLPLFNKYYLSSSSDFAEPPSPTSDVWTVGPKMDIENLASTVFDFLTPVVRTTKAAPMLAVRDAGNAMGTSVMENVLGLVLEYIQVTRANVDSRPLIQTNFSL